MTASTFAWLDQSEEHRRRMRELIDLFREKDTLDELGVGAVRDAFSDLLFPGTSTIQTRGRYFLFVPWVYRQLERDRVPSGRAADHARRLQTRLVYALEAGGEAAGRGVIGWDARETLARLPASVYWNGLAIFGIRRFSGSVEDYHRSLDGYQQRLKAAVRAEHDELYERVEPNWDRGLPAPPEGLFDTTTLQFTRAEAEYVRDRIALSRPHCLLTHLAYVDVPAPDVDLPWAHPAAINAPPHLRHWLRHAENFSDVLHGAALLYNFMLGEHATARRLPNGPDRLEDFGARIEDWAAGLDARARALVAWDRADFWGVVAEGNPRIPVPTREFIDAWIEVALADPYGVAGSQRARSLVEDREIRLKRGQARLRSHRALEMWNGEAGSRPLSFRWPTARVLLADIHEGLANAGP